MRNSSTMDADGNASGPKWDRTGTGACDLWAMKKIIARPVALKLVGFVAVCVGAVLFAPAGVSSASRSGSAGATATLIARDLVPASPSVAKAPSASEFAIAFVEATNRKAKDRRDPARISRPDCVQPAPGRYMCSYVVLKPRRGEECHLMQARWTPRTASTISVTLAGRTTRCGSMREALDSLAVPASPAERSANQHNPSPARSTQIGRHMAARAR